ncbi:hypothetical protein GBAR_LOCUS629 [Geodia barretti]|uniref:Uncharacterized protein n=1 Tax=Geodia barretti TaxID=519541 RepID=A0AA35QU35_GEOBA|nr:hypothetical protein GBAR_LOCUS629 [Geodia barretti]
MIFTLSLMKLVGKDFLFRAEELDELLVKLLLPGLNTLVSELKEALRFVVEQGADVNVLCKKGNRYWRHENKK